MQSSTNGSLVRVFARKEALLHVAVAVIAEGFQRHMPHDENEF